MIQVPESVWWHDMYLDASARGGGGGRVSAIETDTKLFIVNLDFGVSIEDVKVYTYTIYMSNCCSYVIWLLLSSWSQIIS